MKKQYIIPAIKVLHPEIQSLLDVASLTSIPGFTGPNAGHGEGRARETLFWYMMIDE